MKLAFFGYDFFADCLHAAEANGHEVVAVFSNPCDNKRYDFNIRVRDFAKRRKLPFSMREPTDKDIRRLTKRGCELLVVAAYAYRVPLPDGAPPGINIHPSLLPIGRGRWPMPWTILKKHEYTGVSIHRLRAELDAGEIIWQERFRVAERETLESLSARVQMLAREGASAVFRDVSLLHRGGHPQGEGETWPMPPDDVRTLDWTASVDDIDRVARAFGKFGSYAIFNEKEWLVQDATTWRESHSYAPGTVVHRASCEVVIAAADGYVCLRYFEIDPDFARKAKT